VATDLVDRAAFALRRLARRGPAPSRTAAAALLADTAGRLDAALLGQLPELAGHPLVVVPTGALHSVPWSVLPSCAQRPVTVSPSATLWHTANTSPRPPQGPVAVAAGPDLPGAREEARSIAAVHGCTPMLAADATVAAVLAALGESTLVHLAAHGTLATENPLFSRLRLHDGPLVAYDLERLPTVPHTVVLASCDSGRSVVCTGDELLGLSATFIARGAAQLIASVVPIPDAETTPLMIALHRQLASGIPAPTALAAAQQQLRTGTPTEQAAASGFICIGT
jgi:CHAT domain-containing protein